MDQLLKALATLGVIGRAPWAPGTWGSLVGLAFAWSLTPMSAHAGWQPASTAYGLALILGTAVGVVATGRLAASVGRSDPPQAILDETVGMWWSLYGLPRHVALWVIGFLLFRAFDIFKPGLIRRCERLPGGWGIMADDVAAGIATNLCLRLLWLGFRR